MIDVLLDSAMDILKTIPVLLAVYALLYLFETRLRATPSLLTKASRIGPVFGALAGAVPQCGFSAAATTLYTAGFLTPATLVAVFLSTSDEAIPVLLANTGAARNVLLLIGCKIALAIAGGYLLQLTVFRKDRVVTGQTLTIDDEQTITGDCACCRPTLLSSVLWRTAKTAFFLLLTITLINVAVYLIGNENLSRILLGGTLWQPALCALIGLIPGCAISVLLTELFLGGTISFGAAIAGLSTGAGFGYVLLLQGRRQRPGSLRVIIATFAIAVIGGTLVQLLIG